MSAMRTVRARLCAVLALLVVTAVILITSAQAQAQDCSEGLACLWTAPSFEGEQKNVQPSPVCKDLEGEFNSAVNNTDLTLILFGKSGCSGDLITAIEPGAAEPELVLPARAYVTL